MLEGLLSQPSREAEQEEAAALLMLMPEKTTESSSNVSAAPAELKTLTHDPYHFFAFNDVLRRFYFTHL